MVATQVVEWSQRGRILVEWNGGRIAVELLSNRSQIVVVIAALPLNCKAEQQQFSRSRLRPIDNRFRRIMLVACRPAGSRPLAGGRPFNPFAARYQQSVTQLSISRRHDETRCTGGNTAGACVARSFFACDKVRSGADLNGDNFLRMCGPVINVGQG